MKKKLTWMTAAILICGTTTVSAQKAENVLNGKTVKTISFTRENVDIIYADGTKDENVDYVLIRPKSETTAIKGVKQSTTTPGWYTLDGRRMQTAPKAKGIYVVKDGNTVRKTIKK